MSSKVAIRIGLVVVLALGLAGLFAVVSRADNPQFGQITSSLAPTPATGGADVLYNVSYPYTDTRTLNHALLTITLPSGWALTGADPDVCSQSGAIVTCDRGTIRPGDVVSQAAKLTTATTLGQATVSSRLDFSEGPPNPGRHDFVAAPDAIVQVVASDPNRIGKCASKNGELVETQPGAGTSNPLVTHADIPANSSALCSPVFLQETPRSTPTEACFTGRTCSTQIGFTNAFGLFPTSNPIHLTFDFFGSGLNQNMPLYFNGGLADELIVQPCTGPPGHAIPDPCVNSRSHSGRVVIIGVNWSGRDPTWDG